MPFTLPQLPYAPDALEPHIDKMTMEIHHGKHHNAYVTNVNAALEKHPELQSKSVEDLVRGINSVPEAINGSFGGFDKFKEEVAKAGMGRFGSGWAWVIADGTRLSVESTANQDS